MIIWFDIPFVRICAAMSWTCRINEAVVGCGKKNAGSVFMLFVEKHSAVRGKLDIFLHEFWQGHLQMSGGCIDFFIGGNADTRPAAAGTAALALEVVEIGLGNV